MYTHKLLDPLLFFIFEYLNANLKHFLIFTLLSFTLIFKKEMKSLIYLIAKQKWRCLFSSRSIFSFIWQFNFVRSNPIIMQTKNYHWLHPDNTKIHIYVHIGELYWERYQDSFSTFWKHLFPISAKCFCNVS